MAYSFIKNFMKFLQKLDLTKNFFFFLVINVIQIDIFLINYVLFKHLILMLLFCTEYWDVYFRVGTYPIRNFFGKQHTIIIYSSQ